MRLLRDTDQLGRTEIFVVTEAFKEELQAEWRKVEILMSYEELIIKHDNMDAVIGAWDSLQAKNEAYEAEQSTDHTRRLGGLKGACSKAQTKLYKEIDRAFGQNTKTSISVYTMLQHGRLQKIVADMKAYEETMAIIKARNA